MTYLPTDHEVSLHLDSARAAVLEATHRVRSPKRSTRFRTTRTVLIAGAAVVALTAGALIVQAATSDIESTVACYEHPALDARVVSVGVDPATAVGSPIDPIAYCAVAWRTGSLGQQVAPPLDDASDFPVPDLFACVQVDGVGAAFPREGSAASDRELCEAIGLAVWDSD